MPKDEDRRERGKEGMGTGKSEGRKGCGQEVVRAERGGDREERGQEGVGTGRYKNRRRWDRRVEDRME